MDNLRQTYRYIEAYHARLGIFPTQREIGKAFGISQAGAGRRIDRLAELGWISRNDGRRQSLVLKGMPQRELTQ